MSSRAELMDLARELCVLAAAWKVLGRSDKATVLVEQVAALLVKRAGLLTIERVGRPQASEGVQ